MSNHFTANDADLEKKFFDLRSPRDIAELLEVDYSLLVYYLYKVPEDDRYESFSIEKRSGGKRQIFAPATPLKIIQKKLNYVLKQVYQIKAPAHAYLPGKSILSNAQMHVGKRYVLNVDLRDFFPTITFRRVRGLFEAIPYNLDRSVAVVLARICCHQKFLPQGAPSSPMISNMICAKMDSQLRRLAVDYRCVYTRYADDLTFSTNLRVFPESLAKIVPTKSGNEVEIGKELKHMIQMNGFEINKDKIRLQTADRRQVVTGLTVNRFPNVNQSYIKQIRAMLHAWEKFGLDRAEHDFQLYHDKKNRSLHRKSLSFAQVVKGKIEFFGMIRGKDNPTYLKFLSQLRDLAPELVKRSKQDIEDEREQGIKLRELLKTGFNETELRELCFDLGIDFEEVRGTNKSDTIINLLDYLRRRKRIPELIEEFVKKRPGQL